MKMAGVVGDVLRFVGSMGRGGKVWEIVGSREGMSRRSSAMWIQGMGSMPRRVERVVLLVAAVVRGDMQDAVRCRLRRAGIAVDRLRKTLCCREVEPLVDGSPAG